MGLRVHLFGVFEAVRENASQESIDWPRKQTQQLFKILVSERGKLFSQDQLIDLLFPELERESAARNLHKRISEVRKALEPDRSKGQASAYLESPSQGSYRFRTDAPCHVDIEEFERQIEIADGLLVQKKLRESFRAYQQACALYGGEYLAEDLYEDWTQVKRAHLNEAYLKSLEASAQIALDLANYSEALQFCSQVIAIAPGRERSYGIKMRAQHFNGQSQDALATYEQCERALKIELGLTPSPEMSNLYLDILQGRLRRPRPQIPNNLPHEMSSFIGRKSAISDIANRVRNSHLVTLTGVGGAGKTRLSLRVAEELLSEFPDGVWLIELAALSEPEHVITRMAQIFEIRELDERSLEEKIVQLLSNRQALLILDNCEHLISAAAELTQRLLLSSSDLKILATSRESLNISGEVIWPVPPLALDSDNSDAAQLFVERAQSSNPQFHVKQDEADTLLNICQQLDGIPLAIELAASQTRSLTLPQIAERLSNRFSLLGQKSRTALPHQQTLRATMDWSYQLLTEGEQSLLDRLSVFRGGFALEAAEYVCANGNLPSGEILPTLQGLIDKSLISVSRTALQTG